MSIQYLILALYKAAM